MSDETMHPLFPSDFVLSLLNYERSTKTHPPWGLRTTMADFLDAYTLHDSYWKTLVAESFQSDVVIRFDAAWSKGRIPHPGSRVQKWPRLIITMASLIEARMDFRQPEISPSIEFATSEPHPSMEAMSRTTFNLLDGGSVELVHDPTVALLMTDPEGNLIPIPL